MVNVIQHELAEVQLAINPTTLAPRTTFLQLGTAQAHRIVLEANRLARMTKEERLLTTTTTNPTTLMHLEQHSSL